MLCCRLTPRWVLWVAAGALLLRATMPLLATTAAHLRDVPVGEVCNVYGVTLPSARGSIPDAHAHHHAGHAGHGSGPSSTHGEDRCALTALGTLASPCSAIAISAHAGAEVEEIARLVCTEFHDACASWVARLKQGPPDLA